MVYVADSIVPARFLTLTGHLTITLLIFWAKDESIKVCLPPDHTPEDYEYKNKELTVGLSIALGLIGFEFLGFLFGITMFMPMVSMILQLFPVMPVLVCCWPISYLTNGTAETTGGYLEHAVQFLHLLKPL
ncbi:transmembrane protein 107-like isoform X2 [Schistocerca gregaria]|uniref:transmembrane protein 107-like isoform X2 n=1 Tax=Schistocerca gregaria TaxID=7010 RepID=UPI00211E3706|nr:transmembrane protein 107-like isoform X2 [Schistocerca gregaria]